MNLPKFSLLEDHDGVPCPPVTGGAALYPHLLKVGTPLPFMLTCAL